MNAGNQVNVKRSQFSIPMKRPSSTVDSFWLNYGTRRKKNTIKRDDINWQAESSAFNNVRIYRWNLNTSSVLSRVWIIDMCQSVAYILEASN